MSPEKQKHIRIRQKSGEKIPIHVTVRGKIAAAALALTTAAGLGYAVSEANTAKFSEQTHTEVVTPGDTLWGMTDSIENVDGSKREAVDKIKELSPDLRDGVDVGDTVIIPDSKED